MIDERRRAPIDRLPLPKPWIGKALKGRPFVINRDAFNIPNALSLFVCLSNGVVVADRKAHPSRGPCTICFVFSSRSARFSLASDTETLSFVSLVQTPNPTLFNCNQISYVSLGHFSQLRPTSYRRRGPLTDSFDGWPVPICGVLCVLSIDFGSFTLYAFCIGYLTKKDCFILFFKFHFLMNERRIVVFLNWSNKTNSYTTMEVEL